MKVVDPSATFEDAIDAEAILVKIEKAGRTCYKSEDASTGAESAEKFVRMILRRGHLSVLEHVSLTARIVCDRGVTHEIVRHRIASYSQESTRYCNYSSGKFGGELQFIRPCFFDEPNPDAEVDDSYTPSNARWDIWHTAMEDAETAYLELVANGASPQEARSVLPNSLKTEIVMTANLREWIHFFALRCDAAAHPQMREVADMLKAQLQAALPVLFEAVQK